jgi:hypothetical protein
MSILACRACGRELEIGAALLVVDRVDGSWRVVCRPSLERDGISYCIRSAGSASRTAIALVSREAAMQFDRRVAGQERRFAA